MFTKNLLLAFRHIKRYRTYSFLNIIGLGIGMACAMFIIIWINSELETDKFFERSEDIYIVRTQLKLPSGETNVGIATTGMLAPAINQEVPEVEYAIRLSWKNRILFRLGEKSFYEEGHFADSTIFKAFSIPLLKGDRSTVLNNPNSIAISEKLAKKFFNNENPIGKTIIVRNITNEESFTVTGVFKNLPKTSSNQFDYLLPFSKLLQYSSGNYNWGNYNLMTYFLKKPNTNISIINNKIDKILKSNNKWAEKNVTLFSQLYQDMYLYGSYENSTSKPTGRIDFIKIFSVIAIFILFLACMNYTNLATALSIKRAKEVGIKKVFGSSRSQLVWQYTMEAILLTFIAFFLSLIIIEATLPFFNKFVGKEIELDYTNFKNLRWFIIVPIITGLLAGTFPAYYLSSFNPVVVLKNVLHPRKGKFKIRNVFVVIQFVITIVFIIASITVYKQINYIKNTALGLDKDNIIAFEQSKSIIKQRNAFKNELKKQPGVLSVCYTSDNPFSIGSNTSDPRWRGRNPNDEFIFPYIQVDQDFAETFGAEILVGRDFSTDFPADTNCLLINQEALRIMNFENPVGEIVNYWGRQANILGVVKDFHIGNLHIPIRQLIIICRPNDTYVTMVKINGKMRKEALKNIEKVYTSFEAASPFEYTFLDEQYAKNYDDEKNISRFSTLFSVLAILISCLGLFGLALFTAEQKTKEIGIRKSTGATSKQIVFLLATDFLKLISISYAIACALSYYLLNSWLQQFAYRTNLSFWVFLLAGVITSVIVLITVSWQSWKAADRNPVESLRYE
jgi:ABC-type antimicrobial peptide transport system permease subunit